MNALQDVKNKMEELEKKRRGDLEAIREACEVRTIEAEEAEKDMQKAREDLDEDLYTEAAARLKKATEAAKMYREREAQLYRQEFITEDESEATIDSLLQYEKEQSEAYEKAIRETLIFLRDKTSEYLDAVFDTERTIREWCSRIRINRNSRGATIYHPEAAGAERYRANKEIPVRYAPYFGEAPALVLKELFENAQIQELTRE